MTIKDLKTFLKQFDETEKVVDIEFEFKTNICSRCADYYDDEYSDECVKINECSRFKQHKNISTLVIVFKSDEKGFNSYKELQVEDSE